MLGLGWPEIGVILLLALFIVGPERLPSLAADAGRTLRSLRKQVKGLTDDLKTELGPEFADVDLRSLHPRTFVQKHLLDDQDEPSTFDLLDGADARPSPGAPLGPGEPAPWDPDTT
ncbi:MAG TPA: sec-independent translocase [Mycobacteriales bacterium]|nr:sec-independent translocase [Mycobacteriales bacterium]